MDTIWKFTGDRTTRLVLWFQCLRQFGFCFVLTTERIIGWFSALLIAGGELLRMYTVSDGGENQPIS
jgi:hypothetical protein